jgi:signal transduction histidine kinase
VKDLRPVSPPPSPSPLSEVIPAADHATAAPADAASETERLRRALAHARRELTAAREEQERFLSSISHELRTPLSAILLWTSLIEEEKLIEPDQLREAIDAIRRSAEEQQALVQNLVDTARILSGALKLDLQPTSLSVIVRTAHENTAASANEKKLTLESPAAPEEVRASIDRERLQHALRLLLSNAVKFTPEGGCIAIAGKQTGQHVLVTITDTGAGISPEALPRLFDGPQMHRRLAARTESGLGFGLLVARKLIELHHGTLTAESPGPNRGATFTVRLPVAS